MKCLMNYLTETFLVLFRSMVGTEEKSSLTYPSIEAALLMREWSVLNICSI